MRGRIGCSEYRRARHTDDTQDFSLCRCGEHEHNTGSTAYQRDHKRVQVDQHANYYSQPETQVRFGVCSACQRSNRKNLFARDFPVHRRGLHPKRVLYHNQARSGSYTATKSKAYIFNLTKTKKYFLTIFPFLFSLKLT